jgi:uncharacterized protein (TIGR02757 family)
VRHEVLRRRLDELYRQYDHHLLDPDPLQLVRAQPTAAGREIVGLVASGLAFGNVVQIKRSIAAVLAVLGPRPAESLETLDARALARRLRGFRHRWLDGRDVACLLGFARQMRGSHGSIEAFFAEGLSDDDPDVGSALASFSERALALDHEELYPSRRLPARAGIRYFFPSPDGGSACKRLNLYLRWMVRRDGVDLGLWRRPAPRQLVLPLDRPGGPGQVRLRPLSPGPVEARGGDSEACRFVTQGAVNGSGIRGRALAHLVGGL